MVLKTQKGKDIPEGGVLVSKEEALQYQWEFVKNWASETEVLTIKFGRHIASATTFFSSFYIFRYLKSIFHISGPRFLMAVTPGVIVPSVLSYTVTDPIITDNTLLMKFSCPLCDQLKFACCQYYIGLIFPALYGYFSLSAFAHVSGLHPVPNFKFQGREFWKFSYKILKQANPQIQVVGLVHTILIIFLPYLQSKQLEIIMTKSKQDVMKGVNSEFESEPNDLTL